MVGVLGPHHAIAETLKGGYWGCLSEELFDQISTAAVRKDLTGIEYLLKHGCFVLKAGLKVSVLDTTWTGTAKLRVYVGDSAIVIWTVTENIVRD